MKIIFSRKGFDTGAGGCPSPIIQGAPVSLPIPSGPSEPVRYRDLDHPAAGSLGPIVEEITRGKIPAECWAHADPVLPASAGPAALGQQGAAQAHLENQGVGVGDVFVFFGLFRDFRATKGEVDGKPHHRIFGMMKIERVVHLGSDPGHSCPQLLGWERHPHVVRKAQEENNTLWLGTGRLAATSAPQLRLTAQDASSPSDWLIPSWLPRHGLSYHRRDDRWNGTRLRAAARGQEFVSNVGDDPEARDWIAALEEHLARPRKDPA